MPSRGFIGAGDLYIARYNPQTAAFDPPVGPYEADSFEIQPQSEILEMTSKGRDTYGQVLESVAIIQPSEFTVGLREVNKESLTLALLGTVGTVNQAAGTIVDESIVARVGKWVPLSKQNLTDVGLTVSNTAGTTTYVKGVDYEVNYRMGWIMPKAGGAIVEGSSIVVDANVSAVSGTVIRGGTAAQVRARFIFDGKNLADDLPVIVTVHEAVISADSAFDFLADEFNTVTLTGRMKTPVGKSEPFTVELRETAA